MNVDLIFKIAAIGILVSILNVVLTKSGREEMAMMTTLAAVSSGFIDGGKEIVKLFDTVESLIWFLKGILSLWEAELVRIAILRDYCSHFCSNHIG